MTHIFSFRDPAGDSVTAISVYLTPKTSLCGNWIEIAYGTSSGMVRVIVQHPETVGHGPQLFQTFTVHRSAAAGGSPYGFWYYDGRRWWFLW